MATQEYASKGVAGTGLGLGIAGTALALLENNGGLLGGLLGGGNKTTELMVENALLKSQQYTDQQVCPMRVEQARQAEQINCITVQMGLREQIIDGKIAQATLATNNGLTALQGALNCLQRTVDGISATYVPAGKVTPLPQARAGAAALLAAVPVPAGSPGGRHAARNGGRDRRNRRRELR